MKTALTLAATFCIASAAYAGSACEVNSGTGTAALVELYTSEGCSSCPPADRQLSALRAQLPANAAVVPLALHVSYWDQIGWKDPYAQALFDARQSALLEKRRRKVVYTPQFFVNGDELRDWSASLPAEIRRINAIPAPLTITLSSMPQAAPATVLLQADARAHDGKTGGALYLALTESGLVSHVLRGENGGATLRHDDTARLWFGPVALVQGKASLRQQVTLPPGWRADRLQAVAFVQDATDAHILQAVSGAVCQAPSAPAAKI